MPAKFSRRKSTSDDATVIYRKLARWLQRVGREFPWRGETDPYRVWISEIMLVQTTAAVGMKRYPRFLKRFPTLRSLARASTDAVMKEWEGLGYYHRARNLHRAAQIILRDHGGQLPSDYKSLRALPGVGDYVAAAIENLCFGGRRPAIDANIARIGARLFAIEGDVRSAATRRRVQSALAALMRTGQGRVWTESLMDLGATICAPRNPHCESCPLAGHCLAFRNGVQTRIGLPTARPSRREVNVACGIIRRRDGRVLIAQRLATGLLPNLWEFPGGKRDGRETLANTCRREIQEELDVDVDVGKRRMVIRHGYSHYNVRLHVFDCTYLSGRPRTIGCQKFRWARPAELGRLAFPAANQRIISSLQEE
jgi:A/G-specific adenine glycosylase